MLLIAFMLNILRIRFDFLRSDAVLSGKWKGKTQHEETVFLPLSYHREEIKQFRKTKQHPAIG